MWPSNSSAFQLSANDGQSDSGPNGASISRIAPPCTNAYPSVAMAVLSEPLVVHVTPPIRRSYSLQQQRLHPVRVNHLLARRPREDCEAPILRCDERHRVALILDELCGRQMSGAAEPCLVNNGLRAPP